MNSVRNRALAEIELRRNRSSTFTTALDKSRPDLREFLYVFYRTVSDKKVFYQDELAKYDESLQVHFQILVPDVVGYEDFWARYEYRCDVKRVMKEIKQDDVEARQKATRRQSWSSFRAELNMIHVEDTGEASKVEQAPTMNCSSSSILGSTQQSNTSPNQAK